MKKSNAKTAALTAALLALLTLTALLPACANPADGKGSDIPPASSPASEGAASSGTPEPSSPSPDGGDDSFPLPPDDSIEDDFASEGEVYGKKENDDDFGYRLVNGSFYEVLTVRRERSVLQIPAVFNGKPVRRVRSLTNVSTGGGLERNAYLLSIKFSEGITRISPEVFGETAEEYRNLQKISLPASMKDVGSFSFATCPSLLAIDVADRNQSYRSEGGVLFDKSGERLLCYPRGLTAAEYTPPAGVKRVEGITGVEKLESLTLPEGVESVGALSCPNLTALHIASSVESIEGPCVLPSLRKLAIPEKTLLGSRDGENLFFLRDMNFRDLEEITVATGNPYYKLQDGVLFEIREEGLALLLYPGRRPGEDYTVPEGVVKIGTNSFSGELCPLKRLTLPSTLREFSQSSLLRLKALEEVYIPQGVENLPLYSISSPQVKIFCEAPEKPASWDAKWCLTENEVTWNVPPAG